MNFKSLIKNNLAFFIVTPAFIWQLLFFYIPILLIVFISFTAFNSYLIFVTATYFFIILKSVFIALITASLCLIFGYPVAYFISLKAGKLKHLFLFLLMLPFWTNFLLHVYAWFYVLEPTGFLNSFLININMISKPVELLNSIYGIILVMVYCYLPFMVLPIYTILERFDKKLIEASLDLGATMSQTLRHIVIPITITGVKTGFFLVLVPAFAEFAIPGLIGGEKYVFVGTVISQYILANKSLATGAAFTVLSSLIFASFIVIYYLIKLLLTFILSQISSKKVR